MDKKVFVMASLTKSHIQACLDSALERLNRTGARTPWPKEKIYVLSSDERNKIEEMGVNIYNTKPVLDTVDWFVCIEAKIYGSSGDLVIAVNEKEFTEALYDPYEYVIVEWIDKSVRSVLKEIKKFAEEDNESDDYEEQL